MGKVSGLEMELARCEKGHYYDREKFEKCPHCNPNLSELYAFNESIRYVPVKKAELSIYGETGDFAGKNYPIYQGQCCMIGRSEKCDIQLKSEKISKRHCIIEAVSEDTCRIVDLSLNGTFCKNIKLSGRKSYFIEKGSQISLSDGINTFRIIRNTALKSLENVNLRICPHGHIYDMIKHPDIDGPWYEEYIGEMRVYKVERYNQCPICKYFYGWTGEMF